MSEISLDGPNHADVGSGVSASSSVAGDLSVSSGPVGPQSEIYPDDSASHKCAHSVAGSVTRSEHKDIGVDELSIESLHSAEAQSLYITIDGRPFTSRSELYTFPADDEEHKRLDMQHHVLRLTLGSLFPSRDRVAAILRENPLDPPEVMDVGSGSGTWAVDMAVAYPYTKVVGIDLVPPALISKEKLPPNCRFEIDDANLSMAHYASTFSLVHARFVYEGLADLDSFFYNIAQVLKPGGILINAVVDDQLLDEALQPLPFVEPGEPGFTWLQYVMGNCPSPKAKQRWKEWLDANPNYSEVYIECYDLAMGEWNKDLSDQKALATRLFRDNLIILLPLWRRPLVESGLPDLEVVHWLEEARKEVEEMRVHVYFRIRYFIAVRSGEPWVAKTAHPSQI